MSRHRLETPRPRSAHVAALGMSLLLTLVAVFGALGLVPGTLMQAAPAGADTAAARLSAPQQLTSAEQSERKRIAEPIVLGPPVTMVPADSGTGKRIVFSQSDQRVWLVGSDETVLRTYLVSGSVYDNLEPGSYEVFSRSAEAYGIDDSGTMQWFVRFARGENAAIGFHDIPVHRGRPIQTRDQLGTPLSHGCIRQDSEDAKALWRFAPIGTRVVVI